MAKKERTKHLKKKNACLPFSHFLAINKSGDAFTAAMMSAKLWESKYFTRAQA